MSGFDVDKVFSDSIAELYEQYLVPLIFQPYAEDMSERVGARVPTGVLEIAAGTGVVTRRLASTLPANVSIMATDLNPAMLGLAARIGTSRPVTWRHADALQLPFEDSSFDTVVCQFGSMFFSDKSKAFAEVRRVLVPGGVFLFSVWDRIEENEFADVATRALADLFPEDPPRFLARTPHGYHDLDVIQADLQSGGFVASPRINTVAARSRASSPQVPAIAYCQGTPLRSEIEARGQPSMQVATDAAADALAREFGAGAVDGRISAHVVAVECSK